jgi:hypothetical protein
MPILACVLSPVFFSHSWVWDGNRRGIPPLGVQDDRFGAAADLAAVGGGLEQLVELTAPGSAPSSGWTKPMPAPDFPDPLFRLGMTQLVVVNERNDAVFDVADQVNAKRGVPRSALLSLLHELTRLADISP